ncbi:MAG: hypothetical protein IT290_10695 [Deltaproteobacteria bacterium]|nr:hypothetical protein [Deltaproteobacteria bacterium]
MSQSGILSVVKGQRGEDTPRSWGTSRTKLDHISAPLIIREVGTAGRFDQVYRCSLGRVNILDKPLLTPRALDGELDNVQLRWHGAPLHFSELAPFIPHVADRELTVFDLLSGSGASPTEAARILSDLALKDHVQMLVGELPRVEARLLALACFFFDRSRVLYLQNPLAGLRGDAQRRAAEFIKRNAEERDQVIIVASLDEIPASWLAMMVRAEGDEHVSGKTSSLLARAQTLVESRVAEDLVAENIVVTRPQRVLNVRRREVTVQRDLKSEMIQNEPEGASSEDVPAVTSRPDVTAKDVGRSPRRKFGLRRKQKKPLTHVSTSMKLARTTGVHRLRRSRRRSEDQTVRSLPPQVKLQLSRDKARLRMILQVLGFVLGCAALLALGR